MKPDIVFVHGAWVNSHCWKGFRQRYEALGYTCHAPDWPFDDRPVAELKASPAEELAGVGIAEIVEHYAAFIEGLSAPPIIIGHSFGGLFTQLLLARGLGVAGVAIHSAPPAGVLPSLSAIKASLGVVTTWAHWRKVIVMSKSDWAWCFTHQLSEEEQLATYDEFVVPTPGRPYAQAAFSPALVTVDFAKADRAPLLLVAGTADRTVTSDMNEANFKKYDGSKATTEFKLYDGRSHWTLGEPGWEQVADDVIEWAQAAL